MSQPVLDIIYAVNGDSPPQVWTSRVSFIGPGESPSPSPPPDGFWAVDQPGFQSALDAQDREVQRNYAAAEYNRRLALSDQRHQLVDTGMTVDQARILIPDPQGDYSIDAWASE
jgi:hypothetical protein